MNATEQAALGAVSTTASTLMPIILQTVSTAGQAASPQAAAATFAAEIVVALIKANQAGAQDLLSLYQAMGPQIASNETAIDAAAAKVTG
jgi:hypothetical protein